MSAFPPRPAFRIPPSSLGLQPSALFLLAVGCLGMAGQLVLLRELMATYGGNEFSAGVTLAAWLLCEAFGAWLVGRTSYIVHRAWFLAALSILFSLVAVPFAVLVRPLLGVLPGEMLSIPLLLLATFAVALLPAATHGALFVTAAAAWPQGIGSAYVWEGIGTVLAGVACFFLLNRLPSLAVVTIFSLPLVVAAGFGYGRTRTHWAMWALGLGVLTLLVFALPIERWTWSRAWRGQRVVSVANSPYGKIVRLEREGQQVILYDGLPVLTVPATRTEHIEELSLLPVLFHAAPRRVLVLGSDLAIPAALARFRPDIAVTTVQLDPLLARASLSALSSDSALITHHSSLIASLTVSDPVAFLRTTQDAFDIIILTDAVPSSLSSSRLFSLEFYRLCRSRLAPGGLLASATPGNPTGLSPDVAGTISTRRRTLGAAFEYVLPLAADFPLLLASDQPLDATAGSVLARIRQLSEPPKLLDSGYVAGLLDPFRQQEFASQVANHHSPIAIGRRGPSRTVRQSSVASPRELFLNMVRENRLVSPTFGALYARLGSSDIVHRASYIVLLLSAVLLVVGLAGARVHGRPFSRGFAILTSGFSGAAVSSLLLFAWQVRFGSVYSGVALLVAAFMLGTVLGGVLGTRQPDARRSAPIAYRFFAADLVLALSAVAVTLLMKHGPAGAFLFTNCIAGACLGFQFAVAGRGEEVKPQMDADGRRLGSEPNPGFSIGVARRVSAVAPAGLNDGGPSPGLIRRRAGILTALDLVGGSLGGILTALLLVPVFGIVTAALSAGAVKLSSVFVQLAASDRVR